MMNRISIVIHRRVSLYDHATTISSCLGVSLPVRRHCCGSRSGAFLTQGSGVGKNQDPGSGIRDDHPASWFRDVGACVDAHAPSHPPPRVISLLKSFEHVLETLAHAWTHLLSHPSPTQPLLLKICVLHTRATIIHSLTYSSGEHVLETLAHAWTHLLSHPSPTQPLLLKSCVLPARAKFFVVPIQCRFVAESSRNLRHSWWSILYLIQLLRRQILYFFCSWSQCYRSWMFV